ncbi:DUF998 domain-containing protein [Tsukamurella sp. NPDC003166]|uniref:DUF998 domain-containing protein n=1 Tax=Tsukamurella sp. NPDC003166 TaxID=3154444 RepID=UPI0033A44746
MTLSFLYGLLFLATWRILRLAIPANAAPPHAAQPGRTAPRRYQQRWPFALIAVAIAGSLAELLHPGLERSWQRSAAAIDHGELWRLVTSFLIQGGGLWGMGFNLITLVVTTVLGARVFGAGAGSAVWVAGGTVGNLLALALGFPDGAGSSLATMTLAVAAAVAAAPHRRRRGTGSHPGGDRGPNRSGRSAAVALTALAAVGLALVILRDEHAIAAVLGVGLGLALRRGASDRITVGAASWAGTSIFFVAQAIAMAGVTNGYNPIRHMVSDLGMVGCAPSDVGGYNTDVCSPWHLAMNLGFSATGVGLLVGTLLLWPLRPSGRVATAGAALILVGGLGKIGAGLTPGDVHPAAHMAVALFSGPAPTMGLVLLGWSLRSVRPVAARAALACGAVGIAGFAATTAAMDSGWAGLAERTAMYPVIVWVAGAGVALLAHRGRALRPTCVPEPRVPAHRERRRGR